MNLSIANIKWKKLMTALCILSGAVVHAQDLHFSQYEESPLNLNPAMCGASGGTIFGTLNYRSQWASVMGSGNGFTTMAATAEYHNICKNWIKGYLSPGISFFSDKSGDVKIGTTEVALTMASGIYLSSKSVLSLGLQGGWAQTSLSTGNLQWGEQFVNGSYDADASSGEPTFGNSASYIDFSGGLLYKYSTGEVTMKRNDKVKLQLGTAVFHINQPNESFYGSSASGTLLYMRYVLHGSAEFGIQQSCLSLIPGFVYYIQGPSQEVNTGIKVRYYVLQDESRYTGAKKGGYAFDIGAYYRWDDAMIFMLGMKLRDYNIGISYDINTSDLNVASSGRGAVEISLKYVH